MFIFQTENTVKILLLWGVVVIFKILLRKQKAMRFLDVLVGVSSLVLLINLAYVLLDNTSTSFIYGLLAFILGLLVISIVKLIKSRANISLDKIRWVVVHLCVVIPLVIVLGYSHVNNIRYTDYTERSATTIQVSSPLTGTDRVKADIRAIMGMYNENTYQKAKSTIVYGEKVKETYFSNGKWTSYTEYKTKPDIVIQNLGVNLNNTKDKTYDYYAVVNIPYVKDGNKQGFNTFLVTAKYQNDELIDLIRRRVN